MGICVYTKSTYHKTGAKPPSPLPKAVNSSFRRSQEVAESTYAYKRDISLEFDMEKEHTVIIVPALFEEGKENKFDIRVYVSAGSCTLSLLQK